MLERPAALQKLTRYLREKVKATGSVSSMSTLSSGFSTLVWLRSVTAPLPMSPLQENLTPSLDASMATAKGDDQQGGQRGEKQPPHTRLGQRHQIHADAPELLRRHRDGRGVLGLGDAQVLLVNVHELQVVLAEPVALAALEDEVQDVGRVLGLEGEDVLVLGRAEHLGERGQVDAQGDVAVAAVGREALGLEHHGHQRDVRVVHGLQRDARVIAVEVTVLHQIFDGVDHLGASQP